MLAQSPTLPAPRSTHWGQTRLCELDIPASSDAGRTGSDSDEAPRSSLAGARILVVEDDVQSAKLLFVALTFDWAVVRVAADAPEALAIVPLFQPDLMLIDLVLPGLGGLFLAEQLKADVSTRDIPLIAVTAFDGDDVERLARDAGFSHYLRKPVDTANLPGLLESYLRRSRARKS